MSDTDDDIPVLTDAIERKSPEADHAVGTDIDALQDEICASSLRLAEEMVRDACREAEHVLLDRVMRTLRSEMPSIVRGILNEHLKNK